uniref:Uncharacterized protein n=1 Tax=Rhizophora mucronata TaxID=61149 RepID=A0A2P2PLN9_RHIMU
MKEYPLSFARMDVIQMRNVLHLHRIHSVSQHCLKNTATLCQNHSLLLD